MSDQVFVYTMNQGLRRGKWSRYVFPFTIEYYAYLNDSMYLRAGDNVYKVVEGALHDSGSSFNATIQWPWLDFGTPGVNKILEGFDVVGTGNLSVEVGTNQNDFTEFTASVNVPNDTVPGQIIPLPVNAPSFSVKLTYNSLQNWEWNSFKLHVQDQRDGS